ncbi:MAG: hypothetical protein R2939_12430, partial [Kofleriaceae bacterium]
MSVTTAPTIGWPAWSATTPVTKVPAVSLMRTSSRCWPGATVSGALTPSARPGATATTTTSPRGTPMMRKRPASSVIQVAAASRVTSGAGAGNVGPPVRVAIASPRAPPPTATAMVPATGTLGMGPSKTPSSPRGTKRGSSTLALGPPATL